MNELKTLIKRNCRLFFKDKGLFFTSLITPMILLVLYVTFLENVYKNGFISSIPKGINVDENIISGIVGGELVSSLLAVSCITVAFCSNFLMVQDKVSGARKDLNMTPVSNTKISIGYYISSLASTLIICLITTGICFIYLKNIGWYLSTEDVISFIGDVIILVIFGTVLSSIINCFLSSQGQISAVGTIVSSGYGFICGAYMPISSFSDTLQKIISFLPGTYGTSLIRNHALGGAFEKLANTGVPKDMVDGMKDAVDCNLYFYDHKVGLGEMYGVLLGTIAILIITYIIINKVKKI